MGVSRPPHYGGGPSYRGIRVPGRPAETLMADAANGGAPDSDAHGQSHGEGFWALALGSVGVVFGDIGTSPLYAMREALAHSRSGGTATRTTSRR